MCGVPIQFWMSIESVLWPGIALAVFVVTAVLVDVLILLAPRWQLVDHPNERSAHALPTARGGGLSIVLTTALAALGVCLRWPQLLPAVLGGVIVPALVIAAVGLIDDIRPVKATLRLLIQIAMAIVVIAILGPLNSVDLPGIQTVQLGWLGWPITILWIVGLINAFNFMDGSDGMAALGAVVVGGFMTLIGLQINNPALILMAAFAAAAGGGFLVFNWSPARVFMGDVGSAFLGIYFASLPLLIQERERSVIFLPAVMALWPYVFDPLVSVIRRACNGHNPLVPHREFLFHRLIRSGVSHSWTALLYAVLAALGGVAGMVLADQEIAAEFRGLAALCPVVLAGFLVLGIESRCRRVALAAPPGEALVCRTAPPLAGPAGQPTEQRSL